MTSLPHHPPQTPRCYRRDNDLLREVYRREAQAALEVAEGRTADEIRALWRRFIGQASRA